MKTKQIIEIEMITIALLAMNKELRKRLMKARYEARKNNLTQNG